MNNEKKVLLKVTESTMMKLIKHEIVLPSDYLETFIEEGNQLELDVQDAQFNDLVDSVIRNDLKNINDIIDNLHKNIAKLDANTDMVKAAIENKDETMLEKAALHLNGLKEDVATLKKQLFSDDITSCHNRRWVFETRLGPEHTFKDFGFIVSCNIRNFKSFTEEYSQNVGDKLIKYVSDFIITYLQEQNIKFEIARYAQDNFLVFIDDMPKKEIVELFINIQNALSNYSLKLRNKIFKVSFNFAVVQFAKGEPFSSILDQIEEKQFQDEDFKPQY